MIKSLRKRHLQVWTILLVLIPSGIIGALLVRPEPVNSNLLQPASTNALGNIIKTREKENYTINLRGDDRMATQLEWINKLALTVPTAVIYKIRSEQKGIEGADLIGRIETRGAWRFALQPDSTNEYHFILYDFIHQQIIDSINFQP
jgi:hypothetical protein